MEIRVLSKYDTCVANPVPQKRKIELYDSQPIATEKMVEDYEFEFKRLSSTNTYKIVSAKQTRYHAEIIYIYNDNNTKWAISWDIS